MIDGIGEVKTALDIIKSVKQLLSSRPPSSDGSTQTINAQLLEIQSLLLTTQEKQFTLTERIRELEAEIRQHETWTKEKARYEFQQLSVAGGGSFPVYNLREEFVQEGEEAHRICAACYEDGKKSILSFSGHPILTVAGLMSYCPIHEWGNVPLSQHQF